MDTHKKILQKPLELLLGTIQGLTKDQFHLMRSGMMMEKKQFLEELVTGITMMLLIFSLKKKKKLLEILFVLNFINILLAPMLMKI